MSFPTVVEVKKFTESANGTTHTLPAFSNVQAHDVIYAVICVAGAPSVQATGLPWTSGTWTKPTGGPPNNGLTWVRALKEDAAGGEGSFVVTTGASKLAAGVGVQIRGASAPPVAGYPNKAELQPHVTNNPGLQVAPMSGQAALGRVPERDSDSGGSPDSLLVVGFVRVGNNTFSLTINDPMGNGSSDGAPYVATRERDMNWVAGTGTGPDGNANLPMMVADHAESSDGSWQCQAALATANVPAAEWQGHNWSPFIYAGSVGITYWPINGTGQTAVPSALLGLRVKGA